MRATSRPCEGIRERSITTASGGLDADLRASRRDAVAEIEDGIKAKSLELLLPLEALVFVPVNQSNRLHRSA